MVDLTQEIAQAHAEFYKKGSESLEQRWATFAAVSKMEYLHKVRTTGLVSHTDDVSVDNYIPGIIPTKKHFPFFVDFLNKYLHPITVYLSYTEGKQYLTYVSTVTYLEVLPGQMTCGYPPNRPFGVYSPQYQSQSIYAAGYEYPPYAGSNVPKYHASRPPATAPAAKVQGSLVPLPTHVTAWSGVLETAHRQRKNKLITTNIDEAKKGVMGNVWGDAINEVKLCVYNYFLEYPTLKGTYTFTKATHPDLFNTFKTEYDRAAFVEYIIAALEYGDLTGGYESGPEEIRLDFSILYQEDTDWSFPFQFRDTPLRYRLTE